MAVSAVVPSPPAAAMPGPPRAQATASDSFKRNTLTDAVLASAVDAPPWTFYSTAKLLALHRYCETASAWRVAAVLLLTPAPAFVVSVLPSLVPLEHPLAGAAVNRSLMLHCFLCIFVVSYGTIELTLGATRVPRAQYSLAKAVGIALVVTAVTTAFGMLVGFVWRFPVPFFDLVLMPLWLLTIWLLHKALLRREFAQFPSLAPTLFAYGKPLALQSSQFGVYTLFTIVLERLSTLLQVLMVVAFPLVKFALKRTLRRLTRGLEERSAEVVVSTIEICASLYQSMIMQTAPSALALAAIMGVDFVQAILAIKLFMGRRLATPRREVFARAVEILARCDRARMDSRKFSTFRGALPPDESVVVTEALQLASAVERVVLVEYFEVSVPVVNALFLAATYRSSSTLYNSRLNRFYDHAPRVWEATQSVLLYSLLQGASLVLFLAVLRRRHNMSALYQLAFVLEHHVRSIQGKLCVFFTVIFYFTLLHYGVDFSLRFDVARLMDAADMRVPPPP